MDSDGPDDAVRTVADAAIRSHDPAELDWNWGPGVLMAGMMRAADRTEDDRYVDFVREWADAHLPHLGDRLAWHDDYCGCWGPGFPVLQLYEATGVERYGEAAERVIEYVLANAARLDNGAFGHNSGDWARELWVDTAYMVVPLFSNGARVFEEPAYHQESVRQLNAFAAHMQDPQTGLFDHHYDEAGDGRNGVAWARGNGWMAMAYAEALRNGDPDAWHTRQLIQQCGRLLQGLQSHRHADGLWHTVVDNPDTYLESSGAAMVLAALADIERRELFTLPEYDLSTTWGSLADHVDADGRVTNVSGGTGPADSAADYDAIERGTYTWGTGAFLLAASSYADLT